MFSAQKKNFVPLEWIVSSYINKKNQEGEIALLYASKGILLTIRDILVLESQLYLDKKHVLFENTM